MRKMKFILIPIFFIAMAALMSIVVMELWNWLMPEIFDLGTISFWQALGILLLSKILFGFRIGCGGCCGYGSGRRHYWKHKFKHKWKNMSAEDKAKWEEKFGAACCGPVSSGKGRRSSSDAEQPENTPLETAQQR